MRDSVCVIQCLSVCVSFLCVFEYMWVSVCLCVSVCVEILWATVPVFMRLCFCVDVGECWFVCMILIGFGCVGIWVCVCLCWLCVGIWLCVNRYVLICVCVCVCVCVSVYVCVMMWVHLWIVTGFQKNRFRVLATNRKIDMLKILILFHLTARTRRIIGPTYTLRDRVGSYISAK